MGLVLLAAGTAVGHPAHAGPTQVPASGRYIDPVFDDVDVSIDIPYRDTQDSEGSPVTLHLDMYEPAGDTEQSRPVMVWIHGGGFVLGDKSVMAPYAEEFARRGYVGVSLQYRLRPGFAGAEELVDAVLDAYDDTFAAVQWLRDNAAEHRIDPAAISVGGISAGAVNAFNLAYLPGDWDRPDPSNVAAAVPISGLTIGVPQPDDPPVIAFHGSADMVVDFQHALNACAGARAAGLRFDLVVYNGAGHEIGATQFDDIVQRTADFLAETVLGPRGYFGSPFEIDAPVVGQCGETPSEPGDPDDDGGSPEPARPVRVQPDFTG
jgi:acetyl esterase/lipase